MDCLLFLEPSAGDGAAGYYLGYICPFCGPYSRETEYMAKDEAEVALEHYRQNKVVPVTIRTIEFFG